MKFSEQWLREWVNPAIGTDELAHLLTMAGLEVDGLESVAGEFEGAVAEDAVFDIDLTPNRADCLGMRGIAREVGLLSRTPVNEPEIAAVAATIGDTFPVTLSAGDACPRFVARVVRGIDIGRPGPPWMRERLRRAGLRPVDAVVDVTNYVMLELGQPMHAFDLDKLRGAIEVRPARAGEALTLLNGRGVELTADTVVVADGGGAVSMAGIMGGESSAVGESTANLLLEAAWWKPEAIAGKARSYGLHTDASHRFERGADFAMQAEVIERATGLLLEFCGGEAGPLVDAVDPDRLPRRAPVRLRRGRIARILGFAMEDAEVERILEGLGMAVRATGDGWEADVPSWRGDIGIEADLLEELARVYGYNRLPLSRIRADLVIPKRPERKVSLRDVRRRLVSRDFQEAITYSFVDPARQRDFDPDVEPVSLTNPISADLAAMRTSLLPGLTGALAHNASRQQSRVRLFETGSRFLPGPEGLRQIPTLAGAVTGRREPENWSESGAAVDFFDLKGDLEALSALAGEAFRFEAAERPGLHPGQTAAVYRGGRHRGYLGTLHPRLQAACGLAVPACLFEVDLDAVLEARLPGYRELSRYPAQRRDLAVLVDKSVAVGELLENVRTVTGTYLEDLRLFDVYEGKGIDPKRKSLALGLTFRDSSRTLGDEDVNESVDQVIDLLIKTYDAELRR